jgi:hypothetical protein
MKNYNLDGLKEEFVRTYFPDYPANATFSPDDCEILGKSVNAAIARNPTYNHGHATGKDKLEIKEFWKQELRKVASKYKTSKQSADTYVEDVKFLKNAVNKHFANKVWLNNTLSNGLRISHAQKSLAVYLKYLWCLNDKMPDPPCCPVDSTVLGECKMAGKRWTKIDSIREFRSILETVNEKTKTEQFPSIAQWELCIFNMAKSKKKKSKKRK